LGVSQKEKTPAKKAVTQDPRIVGGEEVLTRGQYLGGGCKKKPKNKK
jgi:hypothetical protein